MEWDDSNLDSDSSADVTTNSGEDYCTPKEGATGVSMEIVAK